MDELAVDPDRLRTAAAGIERSLDRLDPVGAALPAAELSASAALLARAHGELHAGHQLALRALAEELRADVRRLRETADAYAEADAASAAGHEKAGQA